MKVLSYLSTKQEQIIKDRLWPSWKWKDIVEYITADRDIEYEVIKETFLKLAEVIKRNKPTL